MENLSPSKPLPVNFDLESGRDTWTIQGHLLAYTSTRSDALRKHAEDGRPIAFSDFKVYRLNNGRYAATRLRFQEAKGMVRTFYEEESSLERLYSAFLRDVPYELPRYIGVAFEVAQTANLTHGEALQ